MIKTIPNPQLDAWVLRLTMGIAQLSEIIAETGDGWGSMVTGAMKANHDANAHDILRYENRTFDLTESIGYSLEPPQVSATLVKHPIRVFAAVPYAFDVEHGVPGRSRAYPFFWREVFSGSWQEAAVADLTRKVNELLASLAERS